jgi:hypothetical protein
LLERLLEQSTGAYLAEVVGAQLVQQRHDVCEVRQLALKPGPYIFLFS